MYSNQVKLSQLKLNTDDQEQFPSAQVSYMGKVCNVTLVQPYGLIGRAPVNNSLVTLFNQQGHESARLGIASCPQLRKKGLVDGEVGLQNVLTGGFLLMDSKGTMTIVIPKDLIETVKNITITGEDANLTLNNITVTGKDLNASLQNVTINATKITLNAEVVINGKTTITGVTAVNGNFSTTGTMLNNTKNVGSTHTHGGVTTGGGTTGVPT